MTVLAKPAEATAANMIAIAGIELEMLARGAGAPILYLHGGAGIAPDATFIDLLARRRRVFAPSHPGFGKSSLPDWLDSVDDIAHVYIELLDRLALRRTDVVGLSLGGWIAAELATKVPERIDRLVLIAPVGVKTGRPDQLDIPDIFARNRETLALLTWEPYMHNPKLKHRLHWVNVPTLFLRGASDGIVSAEYLERYAALIPKARSDTIDEAGHLPQVEQPDTTAAKVLHFLEGDTAAEASGARP